MKTTTYWFAATLLILGACFASMTDSLAKQPSGLDQGDAQLPDKPAYTLKSGYNCDEIKIHLAVEKKGFECSNVGFIYELKPSDSSENFIITGKCSVQGVKKSKLFIVPADNATRANRILAMATPRISRSITHVEG